MLDYIKFPKFVMADKFELNKDDYIEYVSKKQKDRYILFNKDDYERSFWDISKIANYVLKLKGDVIFILLYKDEDDGVIEVIIGNTYQIDNMSYFSKISFNIKNIDANTNSIMQKIKLLKGVLGDDNDVIIYTNDDELTDMLFKDIKYLKHEGGLDELFKNIGVIDSFTNNIIPMFVIGIVSLFIGVSSSYLIDILQEEKRDSYNKEKMVIRNEIRVLESSKKQIIKDIDKQNKILKQINKNGLKEWRE